MKILVVDDSKMMRHVLRGILGELGYSDVVEAGNGSEAILKLKTENIGCIFSDWHMPGGSGLELLQKVRASSQYAKTPFVMVTSDHERENVFKAVKAGVESYVIKPFKKANIDEKLRELAVAGKISMAPKPQAGALKSGSPTQKKKGQEEFDTSLFYRISAHAYLMRLDSETSTPLTEELKKLYPGSSYIYLSDEAVNKTYETEIQEWQG